MDFGRGPWDLADFKGLVTFIEKMQEIQRCPSWFSYFTPSDLKVRVIDSAELNGCYLEFTNQV